ncbi:hypothetical protein [Microlunatus sp. GCM10028923]|uniref:hypothetical protein n=1 Tax=Microlunatus sp. GCM10028923 TaxID=3273400 RepID=UPI003624010E
MAASPDRTAFASHDQRLAPFLISLAEVANSVADHPFGVITGRWWRAELRPFDARVQEYSAVLVWFLTQDRPWNPYRGDPALRARTAAALQRYLILQHPSGAWPEYAAEQHSRSATGFAMESLTASLARLLAAGELPELQAPIAAAVRRAMDWYLSPANTEVWWPGYTPIANQPTGALSGALAFLILVADGPFAEPADDDRRARVAERIDHLLATSQSPAGFFHEPTGSDLGYSFRVMLPRLAELADHGVEGRLLPAVTAFVAWYGRQAVLEPDGRHFILNVAGNARTSGPVHSITGQPARPEDRVVGLASGVPELAAFVTAAEPQDAFHRRWASESAPIPPIGAGTSPGLIETLDGTNRPTEQDQLAALRRLPYLADDHWTELRSDGARQHFWFLRRTGYYLCATFGLRASPLVRTGPGLLWHPQLGTVVHGRNGDSPLLWSTILPAHGAITADRDAFGQFFDGEPPDSRLLTDPAEAAGSIGLRLHDGENLVQTDWVCRESMITATAYAAEPLTQRIPLLLRHDQVMELTDTSVAITAPSVPGASFRIGWDPRLRVELGEAEEGPYAGAHYQPLLLSQGEQGPLKVHYISTIGAQS